MAENFTTNSFEPEVTFGIIARTGVTHFNPVLIAALRSTAAFDLRAAEAE